MKKFFDEKGGLTDWARRMMLDLTSGLDQLMTSDEVTDMTESELRLLGSHLAGMMADIVSKKIARKLQRAKAFSELTDEQFEEYLQEKYGTVWRLVPLTREEYDRCPWVEFEQIVVALQGGRGDRKIEVDSFGPYVSDSND
jgi:hypothetical protein